VGDSAATERLLEQVDRGDPSATGALMQRHRDRLRRMIAFRLDSRLSARVDASDVVQEALAEAAEKLPQYARDRPLPFYPWLRQIAWQKIVHLHQRHLYRQKRTVFREQNLAGHVSELSRVELAQRLVAPMAGPSSIMQRKESAAKVQQAIERLRPNHREILLLRYVELLTVSEMSAVLNITPAAVKMRHIRALERLRDLLDDVSEGP
jgi:RNA polymerase sigma-70 factor (ECF subfamily)